VSLTTGSWEGTRVGSTVGRTVAGVNEGARVENCEGDNVGRAVGRTVGEGC